VIGATSLPCMLYNNPIAYGTDVSAEELSAWPPGTRTSRPSRSDGDVRRIAAIRSLLAIGCRSSWAWTT
jgi:4-hydroxy-tetrahydrodipicolinate synthase